MTEEYDNIDLNKTSMVATSVSCSRVKEVCLRENLEVLITSKIEQGLFRAKPHIENAIEQATSVDESTLVEPDLKPFAVKEPEAHANNRKIIGAKLRSLERKLGRSPTDSDVQAGSATAVFAVSYWGSVKAWSATRPGRKQRQKWTWQHQENQIAAVLDTSRRFPLCPMTHALLNKAGYFALARSLTAEHLANLCRLAGVDRHLRKRPHGYWSKHQTIQAYMQLCKERGFYLSNPSLLALGGDGMTIRTQAKRHFGSFRNLVQAAKKSSPELRIPGYPRARDGTQADSWQEIAFYTLARAAFPDAKIELHVRVPDARRYSIDFVIEDAVYVEVLAMNIDQMGAEGSSWKRKYAERWQQKSAIFDLLELDVIAVEPDDLCSPERSQAVMSRIAERLDTKAASVLRAPSAGEQIRAKGYWNFESLCEHVGALATVVGAFPTHEQIRGAGIGGAITLLKQPGVRQQVSHRLGIELINQKHQWSKDRIVSELAAFVVDGRYPTVEQMKSLGQSKLVSATLRLYGGWLAPVKEVSQLVGPVSAARPRKVFKRGLGAARTFH